jgi:transposase
MLQELTSGKNNPKELAQLAKRRLRAKIPELEKALRGNLRRHHQMIIEPLLADIGLFAAQIAELDAYIENLLRQEQEIIEHLGGDPDGIKILMREVAGRFAMSLVIRVDLINRRNRLLQSGKPKRPWPVGSTLLKPGSS